MSNANAHLTVHGRLLIVRRREAGWTQAHIAAAMGCSRKTVRYWLARFANEGLPGLHDRSTRPRTSPSRLPAAAESAIVTLRTTERLGRDEIAARTGIAPRTVSRVIRRRGLPPLSALDPITGDVIRSSKQTSRRYERGRSLSPARRSAFSTA